MPSRDQTIDLLRFFAIAAVIGIHTIAPSFYFFPLNSLGWKFILLLDQLFRFTVPLFVAISGYTLTKSVQVKNYSWKDFYTRRVLRLIPDYLIWSILIYLFIIFLGTWPNYVHDYPLWSVFLLGKADYHLYFVPMIASLYILFPIIYRVASRFPKIVLALTCLLEVGWYHFLTNNSQNKFWTDQTQYIFFISWIFYFVLGIYLTKITRVKTHWLLIGILVSSCGLILAYQDSWHIFTDSGLIINATRSTRLSVLFYASALISTAILFRDNLLYIPGVIRKGMGYVGKISYIVYLCHTIIVRIIAGLIPLTNKLSLLSIVAFSFIISVLTAHVYLKIYSKTKNLLFQKRTN